MPQRRTAKKALRQTKKRKQKNLRVKQTIKTAIKKLKKVLDSTDTSAKQKALTDVYKVLDKAATKNIIHRNKAARKKNRLAKLLKKSTAKPSV
ncbi:MAG: 30S ribosomal protein S20 [Candidatus Omnitrophota bacterium]